MNSDYLRVHDLSWHHLVFRREWSLCNPAKYPIGALAAVGEDPSSISLKYVIAMRRVVPLTVVEVKGISKHHVQRIAV
jgi:hypothetical protein